MAVAEAPVMEPVESDMTDEQNAEALKERKRQNQRDRRERLKREAAAGGAKPKAAEPKVAKVKAEPKAKSDRVPRGMREGSGPAEAVAVLREAGEALHIVEIVKRILDRGRVQLKGKTPQATIAAKLHVMSKQPDAPVRKTAPGMFEATGQ